jgi:two-component system, LuxR family, sensor kinase FixL
MEPLNPVDQADQILAAILDASDDAIIVTSLEGVVQTWNRGAERLYGYTADEMSGRSIAALIPAGQADDLTTVLDRIRSGKRVTNHEAVRQTKDGRAVDVALTTLPIHAADRVVGAVIIARDLGAQKRAELGQRTSELRWRAVIESAVDGIVVIDPKGRIEAFNPAAERLFGYKEREVLGRNVTVLMPKPYRDEHDRYLSRYLETGMAKIIGLGREVTGLRRDGTVFPLHLSVGEMTLGGVRKFTGILHDLSARVQMEEQLREQAAMAHLGEMAAVIAHEIKNPLAGIRGAVQVIGSRLSPGSRDAAVTDEIVKRIDGLNDLMKDLLLFARPPQPKPAAVNVAELVSSTAGLLADDPSVGAVRVQIEGIAPTIMADAELLKIAFVNLLMNGAHAMGGHGVIRVSVATAEGMCRIAFRDGGPGIPTDIREKIFTPFFTTKSKGTGLGLPTTKRLIDAHAGRIDIECPPSGGTIVTVRLPSQLAAQT